MKSTFYDFIKFEGSIKTIKPGAFAPGFMFTLRLSACKQLRS